jgi:3-oxoacyl-[acyl-carrier-protein] synthase II
MLAVQGPPGRTVPGRRVVVTGIGVLACCGNGRDNFWAGLFSEPPEGERRVRDFDATPYFGPKEVRRVDRFTQLAVAAAEEALADAAGDVDQVITALGVNPERAGVFVGTGVGGLDTLETQVLVYAEKGPRRVTPFLVPMIMCNAGPATISMRHGFRGPCENTVTACAAGTHSVGNAARLIATGRCDVMIAGASEAGMTPVGITGFQNMTALSSSGRSMPFDAERDGFMISEGAGILILEEFERAEARGAHIYAEILGAASNADAHHITAPSPGGTGAVACMELAIADAELTPAAITYINAHGTSTPLNDAAEAEAIEKLFGTTGPPVTSTKGVTGHALGAAGALEAAAVALSMEHRLIPPTAGWRTPDPDIHLDLVVGEPRPWQPGPALSNSFGFGGHNGCLVIGPPPA